MSYPSQRIDLREPPPRLTPEQLARRMAEAYPEAQGPGTEDGGSGRVMYGQPGHPRIGAIPYPSGMDRERIWAERAQQEAELAAMSPAERAARADLQGLIRQEIRRA